MTHTPRTPTSPTHATHAVARGPEDLVAVVPLALGFEPVESVTLLTFGEPGSGATSRTSSRAGFHARIDLPHTADGQDGEPHAAELEGVVGALLDPVVRHRVSRAAIVVHSARPRLTAVTTSRLVEALEALPPVRAGAPAVEVLDVLRADGRHWWRLPDRGATGTPYDLRSHPFTAQAVLAGLVVHRSREELAATLDPDAGAVARVRAGLPAQAPGGAGELEERWARRRVLAALEGHPLVDEDVARLVHHARDGRVRDAALSPLTRDSARGMVDLWSDVLRRTPPPLRQAPGTVLAVAAWVAGDGALAWCALDRVRAVAAPFVAGGQSAYPLADLVEGLLRRADHPSTWVHDGSPFSGDLPVLTPAG